MAWNIHKYGSNATDLAPALAAIIAVALAEAIQQRGRATLAVSGGNTPRALFAKLSEIDIPWGKVTVTLVDERWVAESHSDSNAQLVRQHLLCHRAAEAEFIGLKTDAEDPFLAEAEVEARLRAHVMPIDVAVLGMGEDGHTASFFPGAEGLEHALGFEGRVCAAVRPVLAPHARMTLTLETLLNARKLFLHFIGARKLAVLKQAMLSGPMTALPVRAVLQQNQVMLEIHYSEQE
jgi:6-phosphogluconolactonase